ncbi:uncharacterized protein C6G9.01c-like [Primulina eburnea]|uniref:uncharacterized protein C6G9.01c-like n=1 Tax=Primulina eburnea TaxID=1245227 RepID=UPI003C6CAC1F
MMKESSSKKKIKPACCGPVVEKEKPSLKPKRMGSEIDEIFARTKRKRSEKDTMADKQKPSKASASSGKSHDKLKIRKNKTKDVRENPFADSIFRPRKKTSDGLAIYTEEELSFGKPDAGGTRLCPFDCDCCFDKNNLITF